MTLHRRALLPATSFHHAFKYKLHVLGVRVMVKKKKKNGNEYLTSYVFVYLEFLNVGIESKNKCLMKTTMIGILFEMCSWMRRILKRFSVTIFNWDRTKCRQVEIQKWLWLRRFDFSFQSSHHLRYNFFNTPSVPTFNRQSVRELIRPIGFHRWSFSKDICRR